MPTSPPTAPKDNCPIERTLAVIGGKWTVLILRGMLAGPIGFAELRDGLPRLSGRVLARELKHLTREGVVCRRRVRAKPLRVTYELTAHGLTLRPILEAMATWGANHAAASPHVVARGTAA